MMKTLSVELISLFGKGQPFFSARRIFPVEIQAHDLDESHLNILKDYFRGDIKPLSSLCL
jgi:hypothetical protein